VLITHRRQHHPVHTNRHHSLCPAATAPLHHFHSNLCPDTYHHRLGGAESPLRLAHSRHMHTVIPDPATAPAVSHSHTTWRPPLATSAVTCCARLLPLQPLSRTYHLRPGGAESPLRLAHSRHMHTVIPAPATAPAVFHSVILAPTATPHHTARHDGRRLRRRVKPCP
jgi:hypothetical protein